MDILKIKVRITKLPMNTHRMSYGVNRLLMFRGAYRLDCLLFIINRFSIGLELDCY
jgi:hypothetical protein